MTINNKQYNLYNLEAKFKTHLSDSNYSRISSKNYIADVRAFLNWFSHSLRSQHLNFDLNLFTASLVKSFSDYLVTQGTPIPSVNRSLSSIRCFSKFLLKNNLISNNPLENISNLKETPWQSLIWWIKSNIKSIISFLLGFILISFIFIVPSIVSSVFSNVSINKRPLNDNLRELKGSFPGIPAASTSADLLTVPIIDANGNLNLTASYPKIVGYTGTLTIESPGLTLASKNNGNLKLQTEIGTIHFLFEGEKPVLPYEAAFYFTAENLKSGALIYGEVKRESDAVSLLELSSGSPADSKFRVDSEGNVYIKGNVVLEGNLIVSPDSTIFGNVSSQTATSSSSSSR